MLFFDKKNKLALNVLRNNFDNQVSTLIKKGYPDILNIAPENFKKEVESSWKLLEQKMKIVEFKEKNIPLLIIVQQK